MQDELGDDPPIRGTRLLSNIYQRCNVAICESGSCEEALKLKEWKNSMEEDVYDTKRLNVGAG